MARVPNRLKLNVPNVPAVFSDEITQSEWNWLKLQHPGDYATAQKQIKEHSAALAVQDAEDAKKKEGDGQPAGASTPASKPADEKAAQPGEGNSSKGGGTK